VQYQDGALFTTIQATNAIWRKLHRHLALVTKSASLIRSVGLAVIMKHGKAAVITGGSKSIFIEVFYENISTNMKVKRRFL